MKEILSQVLIPVIGLYSNEKIKFPNGHLMRRVVAYKVLDIILLLSLRIGPEQTRIEMGRVIKTFFEGFSLVHANVMGFAIPVSKPLKIQPPNQTQGSKNNSVKNYYKPRASIAFAPLAHQKASSSAKENILLSGGILDLVAKESFSDETAINSFDEYLKYSYDQSTNEIVGSSLKTSNQVNKRLPSSALSVAATNTTYKFRSQSIGLLSLNSDGKKIFKLFFSSKYIFFKFINNLFLTCLFDTLQMVL